MATRPNAAVAGFLAMAFVIVGLAGVFATYAAPIPLTRALRHEEALDQVLAAAASPDAKTNLAALEPVLGASATAVLKGPGPIEQRVAQERSRLLIQSEKESAAVGARLRLLIVIATLAGGIMGVAMLGVGRREA